MIKVQATYDPSLQKLITRLQSFNFRAVAKLTNKEFAISFIKVLRDGIIAQNFRQPALTSAWKQRKKATNLDERRLIATKAYLASIDAYPVAGGDGYVVGSSSPLAVLHEYGYRGTPARPHWRPALRRWAAATPNEKISTLVNQYLRTGNLPLKGETLQLGRKSMLAVASIQKAATSLPKVGKGRRK